MAKNRMFGDTPKRRLIVSVDDMTVEAIDKLLESGRRVTHPAAGNRSEFVRMAIKRELKVWALVRPNNSDPL